MYNKTNILGLRTLIREKFSSRASNGKVLKKCGLILRLFFFKESKNFLPHKIMRKNSDPVKHNRGLKRLNAIVRRASNRNIFYKI
jgi:hypothetical protein